MKIDTIYHLSHIDLDGYSCQMIMSYTPYDILSYNANYGAEVKSRLEEIIEHIKLSNNKNIIILITDLNLTYDESKWLNNQVARLNDIDLNISLTLLDHHGSGQASADKYEWYFLDTTRSATKITYEYAKENFELSIQEWMPQYVDIVNAVDLWKQEEVFSFEFGKVLLRLIAGAKELNRVMFKDDDRLYKFSLLQQAVEYISYKDAHIQLDNAIHKIKKDFFTINKNDTLDNLATKYIVNLLSKQVAKTTIYYKGYKGFLSYGVGNTSIIGNGFLITYPDYDFIVDISYRGTMSFRADGKVNVAQIAKEWVKGGGHPNAAGGRLIGFKEQYRYSKVKDQIEQLIAKTESIAGDLAYKN